MNVASDVPTSPYKGLTPFGDSELDALLFFGRERDSEIVVANLIAARLTVLYGASGVGKSSMLRASVARALRELPERPLVVVFSSWGDDPLGALVAAVAEEVGVEPAATLVETLERGAAARGDVYLILDQAEEYFLYHSDPGRFEQEFARVVTEPLRVNVLLSLREDALAQLDRFKARIPNIFGNYLRLDRLDRAAGRDAILLPVERYRALGGVPVEVEPTLVETVLDQVAAGRIGYGLGGLGGIEGNGKPAGIEAPFLQLVMQRVWEVERAGGSEHLRAATLAGLGGAGTVVADHLERAMDALTPPQRHIAAQLFRHLVTPSGTKIAHDVADLADYTGFPETEVRPVVAALAEHRILRPDEGGRHEIFHDVLAGAVLGWRTRYEAERAVERARAEARRRHRRLGFLAFGALVALAAMAAVTAYAFDQRNEARSQQAEAGRQSQRALEKERLALDEQRHRLAEEKKLLEEQRRSSKLGKQLIESRRRLAREAKRLQALRESVARQTSRLDRLRDETRQREARVAALEHEAAELKTEVEQAKKDLAAQTKNLASQRKETNARQLVVASTEQLPVDPELGLLLAEEAAKLAPASPSVENGLRAALRDSDLRATWPLRGPGSAVAVGGGTFIAGSKNENGDAVIAAAVRGAQAHPVRHGAPVTAAAVSRDGAHAATGGSDGRVRLWTTTGGPRAVVSHSKRISGVAFSPDGESVATASEDRTVKLWERSTGRSLRSLLHGAPVRGVDFSPDGRKLLTWGGREVRVYDLETNDPPVRLEHETTVLDAEQSRDGTLVATAGADRAARLWRIPAGTLARAPISAHGGRVTSVAFSPDGKLLATASTDNAGRVWDVASGTQHAILGGHTNFVTDVRFSPDGRWVVTAGDDGTARVSDVSGTGWSLLAGHRAPVKGVRFAADGTRVVTVGEDGTARLWDPGTTRPLVPTAIASDRALVGSPATKATSPDGRTMATADGDAILLEDVATGKTRRLVGHTDTVNSVAFSPDSRTLVTASQDHDVRVWDVRRGVEERILSGHSGAVTDARFSPDGRWVVTAGPVTVGLWTVDGWTLFDYLRGPEPLLTGVAFGPDSRRIVTTERSGTARRWMCTLCGRTAELLKLARSQLSGTGRKLTAAERERVLGGG